MRASVLSG